MTWTFVIINEVMYD